jgi:hypothetical protein
VDLVVGAASLRSSMPLTAVCLFANSGSCFPRRVTRCTVEQTGALGMWLVHVPRDGVDGKSTPWMSAFVQVW